MNEELYHYGVQGMKWGRRKDPEKKQSYSDWSKKALKNKGRGARIGARTGYVAKKGYNMATTAGHDLADNFKVGLTDKQSYSDWSKTNLQDKNIHRRILSRTGRISGSMIAHGKMITDGIVDAFKDKTI